MGLIFEDERVDLDEDDGNVLHVFEGDVLVVLRLRRVEIKHCLDCRFTRHLKEIVLCGYDVFCSSKRIHLSNFKILFIPSSAG